MERFVRVVALVAVLGAAVLPWNVRPVAACSCAVSRDATNLDFSDTVFSGTALSVKQWDGEGWSDTPMPSTFAVDHVWVGDVEPTVVVWTAAGEASCGYTFQQGKRYVVYARSSTGVVVQDSARPGEPGQPVATTRYETNYCSPTHLYDAQWVAALESVAGRGRAVTQPTNGSGRPALPGVAQVPSAHGGSGAATTSDLLVALAVTSALIAGTLALSRRR